MTRTARRLTILGGLGLALLLPNVRANDETTVTLCDGEQTFSIEGLSPGQTLPPQEARKVAQQMLQTWRSHQTPERWAAWERDSAAVRPVTAALAQAATQAAAGPGQPTKFTARDLMLWKRAEKKWIEEGYKAYHNAQAMGSTNGISCDMCHPDGSNTHPETYPKFQVQLKKVALLRDMINWCIENPLKGKPMPEDSETLRAVEAYILSTRQGVALEPGKH